MAVWRRLASLFSWLSWFPWYRRHTREADLARELRDHLELETDEQRAAGLSPEQAAYAAHRALGNTLKIEEDVDAAWGFQWLETLVQDVRYGLRQLRRTPGFTAVAILTLALGIGANTALFSLVNGVLLDPLPYPHPEQIVTLHEGKPNFPTGSISYPNFRDWQRENRSFSAIAIERGFSFNYTGQGPAERLRGGLISSDFFSILGIKPVIGRLFAPGEDEISASPVVLLGGGFWQRKFGGSTAILGKNIALDGRDYRVIGVIPQSFGLVLPNMQSPEDVYVPIGQWAQENPLLLNRGAGLGIHGIGRVKPGVTLAQAQQDLNRVTAALSAEFPVFDHGIGASMIPLKQPILGDIQPFLLVLLGAVGFVLLIVCLKVANLLLVRSASRRREFAVRSALGASLDRLVRQLLTEGVLLALIGASLGLTLAKWGTQGALSLLPATSPRASEIHLDGRVLLFLLAISIAAALLFGLVPARRRSPAKLQESLKDSARGASFGRQRAQQVFVVLEVAIAVVLLAGVGLMIRSPAALWVINPGFEPKNVLTFGLSLPPSFQNANADAVRAELRQIHRTIESVPGVQAVSLFWSAFPFSGDDEQLFWFEGQPKPQSQSEMNWALRYVVEPGYLQAMGIPLERGRFLTEADDEHAPLVVVVDDVFARQFFSGQNAVGKRIYLRGPNKLAEIVGVVGHVNQWGLDSESTNSLRAQVYAPYMQLGDDDIKLAPAGTSAVIRHSGSGATAFAAIRRSLQQTNRDNLIYGAQAMDSIISDSLASRRFSMIVLGAFAGFALLLAAIGIYGVTSYQVGERTHEIGIRLALGAHPGTVLRMILGSAARMSITGLLIGFLAAVALTRLMSGTLLGVSPLDPATFLAVAVVLGFVALAASYIPARRAMKLDPTVALRYE